MSNLSFIPEAPVAKSTQYFQPSSSERKTEFGAGSFDQFLKSANEKQFKTDPFQVRPEQPRSDENKAKPELKKDEFKTAEQSPSEEVAPQSNANQEADTDGEAKETSRSLDDAAEKVAAEGQNEAEQKDETPVDANQAELLALLAQLAEAEAVIRGETQPETIQIAELSEAMADPELAETIQGIANGSAAENLQPVENSVDLKLKPDASAEGKAVNLGEFNQVLAQISGNASQTEGESLFNQGRNPNANSLISEPVKHQTSSHTVEDGKQSIGETFLGVNSLSQKTEADAQPGKDRVLAQHDQSSAKSGKVDLAVIQTHLAVNDIPEVKTEAPVLNLVSTQPGIGNVSQLQTSGSAGVNPANREKLFAQIVEHAKVVVSNGGSEMEINLKPEHLGKLQLKVTIENEVVTAKFVAESQQVKEIIESNLGQLKRNLQESGMQVDSIMVSVGYQPGSESFEQTANSQEGFSNFKGSADTDEEELNLAAEDPKPQAQLDTVIDLIA